MLAGLPEIGKGTCILHQISKRADQTGALVASENATHSHPHGRGAALINPRACLRRDYISKMYKHSHHAVCECVMHTFTWQVA